MCGLFGVIYKKKQKLDKIPLISLGRDNVKRGKDSCGLIIDNEVEYGIGNCKDFNEFFKASKLLKTVDECNFVIGHTRAASPGFKTDLQQAQPICIYEGDKLMFAITHNGTIENKAKDLAQKYLPGVEVDDNTDSWILAHIMYKHGFDVLGEYKGYGAFIIVDYRLEVPRIFIFKGASKQYKYSTDLTVERPLFVTQEENAIWWASECSFLEAARFGNAVYSVKANTLYEVDRDNFKLQAIRTYDRSWYVQQSTSYYGGYARDFSDYDYASVHYYYAPKYGTIEEPLYRSAAKMIFERNGLYTLGGKPAHGIYELDDSGYPGSKYTYAINNSIDTYAFFEGYLLYHEDCFRILNTICSKHGLTSKELVDSYPEIVSYLSYLPYLTGKDPVELYVQKDLDTVESFDGLLQPPFASYTSYLVKEGHITQMNDYSPNCHKKYSETKTQWQIANPDEKYLINEFSNFIERLNA